MPIDTVVNLVILLRQYRLLDAAQLDELARTIGPRFPDPRSLAKELIQRNWLTPYQINQLFQGRGDALAFENFLLLERLGEGGMGQVFKARHRKLGQIVALKIIRKDRTAGPDSIRRFIREIETASQLVHPNVVRAIDAGDVDGAHFFVMEYVEGTDLAKYVKQQGPLPPAQAADYIRQAALGLQCAYENGLVHRDIKPANLLLTKQGVVKLVDMGLARRESLEEAAASTALTQEGSVLGTPDYIAPEQARNSSNADIRADLYSLGCTFYFLLTGQPPFPGGALTEKLLKHQLDNPVPVSTYRSDVPPEMSAVIEVLMAKRPDDRYQTPGELAAALSNGTAPPPRPSGRRPATGARPQSDSGRTPMPPAIPVAAAVQSDPGTIPMAAPVAGDPFADLDTPAPASITRIVPPAPVAKKPRHHLWLLPAAAVLVVLLATLGGVGAKMFLSKPKPPDEANKDKEKDKEAPADKDKSDKDKGAKPPIDWAQAREALYKKGARFVPAAYDPDPNHPITSVDLSGSTSVRDADLINLTAFPNLTALHLGATKITDKGLVHVEGLTKLTSLWLNSTAVSDDGLAHLKELTELGDLNLAYTQVQGRGLTHVQGAKKLKILNLTYSKIDDAGLAALEGLPQLEQLILQVPPNPAPKQITNLGMVHLKGLTKLKTLSLQGSAVTDAGMVNFQDVGQHLTTLDLTNVKVSDAGLSSFKTLSHLLDLQAAGSNIGDKGLPALRDAKKLQSAILVSTKVQDSALAVFTDKAELKTLNLAGTPVGNEGLKHLATLPKLSSLTVGLNVSDEGLVHLKGLKELQALSLAKAKVQGKGLEYLKGLGKLTFLDLSENAKLDDDGLKYVGELAPLTTLYLHSCRNFTDAGVAHLKGLKKLATLYLVNTAISDKAVADLKEIKTLLTLSLNQSNLVTPEGFAELKTALPKTAITYP